MNDLNIPDVSLKVFIDFLIKEGYEITMKNPRHVPGQGYSAPPYYSNVDIEFALRDFCKLNKIPEK